MHRNETNDDDISLDDLYHMTAFIYSEQNAGRSRESTFNHFVEVCGLLSSIDRNKPRGEIDIADALCKSLAWYFPLLAKFGVSSVERLVFRKYPMACPYCRLSPHSDMQCKSVRGLGEGILNHQDLVRRYAEGFAARPRSLDAWQSMFNDIYPRNIEDRAGRNSLGLMEELGELAEAIRVFEREPRYFVGEAADVFSYLMGFANNHMIRHFQETQEKFSLETEYLTRYPGMCIDCGYAQCRCPHIPDATIGRMAKELQLDEAETIFYSKIDYTPREIAGSEVSTRVFDRIGGYPALIDRFKFDRGQANQDMAALAIQVAESVKEGFPELAASLLRNALRLRQAETQAGQRLHSKEAAEAFAEIQKMFHEPAVAQLDPEKFDNTGLARAAIPSMLHVLVVASRPQKMPSIATDEEFKIIKSAIAQAKYRERFHLELPLLAAEIHDVSQALLDNRVDVVHFSCHGDQTGIVMHDGGGDPVTWKYDALLDVLAGYDTLQCLVLNSCESDAPALRQFSGLVIAMKDEIYDAAGIEFARGFYQALGAGKSPEFAARQAESLVKSQGFEDFRVSLSGTRGVAAPEASNGEGSIIADR